MHVRRQFALSWLWRCNRVAHFWIGLQGAAQWRCCQLGSSYEISFSISTATRKLVKFCGSNQKNFLLPRIPIERERMTFQTIGTAHNHAHGTDKFNKLPKT